jgi:hypothetical protein
MTYFTTKTVLRNLEDKLQELADDGHTIISVVNVDGFLVIISTKS